MNHDTFGRRSKRMLALAALTATAVAAKPGAEQPPPAPQGMKAFKDPATGELTAPTAQQAAELEAAKQAKTPPKALKGAPATFALPQGGVRLKLDESHMSESVAHETKRKAAKTATVKPEEK